MRDNVQEVRHDCHSIFAVGPRATPSQMKPEDFADTHAGLDPPPGSARSKPLTLELLALITSKPMPKVHSTGGSISPPRARP